jgi:uncharacterized protein (TIGR03083 family)
MSAQTRIIRTAHLFAELDAQLIDLLGSLTQAEWTTPTIVPRWNVHQIAAHLLDTALRRLSLCRDGWVASRDAIRSERDLIDLVNRLNAEGVALYGRISPPVLLTLTRATVPELAQYVESLDPMAPAPLAVSWAGETTSANWFDTAREFTERWHHQQQIRLAVGRPDILTPRFYTPVLDTFMRALPRAYQELDAPDGTMCHVIVPGDGGGTWQMARRDGNWTLDIGVPLASRAEVAAATSLPRDIAWRVFTKGISAAEARSQISMEGDERLGAVALRALAIVG